MSLSSFFASSLLKVRAPSRNPNPKFRSTSCSLSLSSSKPRSISIRPSFSSDLWASPDLFPVLYTRSRGVDVAARSAAGESAGERSADAVWSSLQQTLQLGSLFGLWYLFEVYFNIYNKQVLNVFPFPMTMTTCQFAVGAVFVLLMWATNLYKKPKISTSQLVAILPLAIFHTLGNLFTNMSLGKVAVSFTHTIKAMEPFFSVVLSALFLGELPNLCVVFSLMPIVGGVAVASLYSLIAEASCNWAGFWSAMASDVTFQSRNVLSKKLMVKKEESLDIINLFSIITIMSLFLLAPVTLFMEGVKVSPTYLQSAGLNLNQIYVRSLLAGLCFHAYQQVSYMILSKVSPVTHSVGNCVKRIVVIVTSVLFFGVPVSSILSLLQQIVLFPCAPLFVIRGTEIALAGVFLYSLASLARK